MRFGIRPWEMGSLRPAELRMIVTAVKIAGDYGEH
jgi:hypothetical protein